MAHDSDIEEERIQNERQERNQNLRSLRVEGVEDLNQDQENALSLYMR